MSPKPPFTDSLKALAGSTRQPSPALMSRRYTPPAEDTDDAWDFDSNGKPTTEGGFATISQQLTRAVRNLAVVTSELGALQTLHSAAVQTKDEPTSLPEALGVISALRAEIDLRVNEKAKEAEKELASAAADLVGKESALLIEARAEIARLNNGESMRTLRSELETVKSEREQAQTKLTRSERSLSLLEKSCGIFGVDPSAAISADSSAVPSPSSTLGDFEARIRDAKTPEAKDKAITDFQEAVRRGKIKP